MYEIEFILVKILSHVSIDKFFSFFPGVGR
jgi:hypothetical protein